MLCRTCETLTLTMLSIILFGCQSFRKTQTEFVCASSAFPPNWLGQSIFDFDEEYVYFVGVSDFSPTEREARDDAMNDAMRQIALYSGVNIQVYSRAEKKTDDTSEEFVLSDFLSEFSAIITGILPAEKFIETWLIEGEVKYKVYILIRIEKNKLKTSIKNTVSENKKGFERLLPNTQNCTFTVEFASEDKDLTTEENELSDLIQHSLQKSIDENNIPMKLEKNTISSSSQLQFLAQVFLDKFISDEGVFRVILTIELSLFANGKKILGRMREKVGLSRKSYQQALKNELRNLELTFDENEIFKLRSML